MLTVWFCGKSGRRRTLSSMLLELNILCYLDWWGASYILWFWPRKYFFPKLQRDTPKFMCSFSKIHSQFTKTIRGKSHLRFPHRYDLLQQNVIKCHHFWSFVVKGGIVIEHIYINDNIADIFTKPLYPKYFSYLQFNLKSCWENGNLILKGVLGYKYGTSI